MLSESNFLSNAALKMRTNASTIISTTPHCDRLHVPIEHGAVHDDVAGAFLHEVAQLEVVGVELYVVYFSAIQNLCRSNYRKNKCYMKNEIFFNQSYKFPIFAT